MPSAPSPASFPLLSWADLTVGRHQFHQAPLGMASTRGFYVHFVWSVIHLKTDVPGFGGGIAQQYSLYLSLGGYSSAVQHVPEFGVAIAQQHSMCLGLGGIAQQYSMCLSLGGIAQQYSMCLAHGKPGFQSLESK